MCRICLLAQYKTLYSKSGNVIDNYTALTLASKATSIMQSTTIKHCFFNNINSDLSIKTSTILIGCVLPQLQGSGTTLTNVIQLNFTGYLMQYYLMMKVTFMNNCTNTYKHEKKKYQQNFISLQIQSFSPQLSDYISTL